MRNEVLTIEEEGCVREGAGRVGESWRHTRVTLKQTIRLSRHRVREHRGGRGRCDRRVGGGVEHGRTGAVGMRGVRALCPIRAYIPKCTTYARCTGVPGRQKQVTYGDHDG